MQNGQQKFAPVVLGCVQRPEVEAFIVLVFVSGG
jgi:hypothetical protein